MKGQILKVLSGFYDVLTVEHQRVRCQARGLFRCAGKEVRLLVGDWVELEMPAGPGEMGRIVDLSPRRMALRRPPIANVDLAVVFVSLAQPAVHPVVVDRLLVQAEWLGIDAALVLSKQDLAGPATTQLWKELYANVGYPIFTTPPRTEHLRTTFLTFLGKRLSVVMGESGVGKSTFLNFLLPERQLSTGAVSQKAGRGRHTTRVVEIFPLPSGGQIADTPGFSQLDAAPENARELASCFPEFAPARIGECQYRACEHQQGVTCAVRQALDKGWITTSRYDSYLHMLAGLIPKKDRPRKERNR